MPVDLKTLREKRAKLVADARQIVDQAEAEGRGLTNEESAQFETMIAESSKIQADIDRRTRLSEIEDALAQPASGSGAAGDEARGRGPGGGGREDAARPGAMEGFRAWLGGESYFSERCTELRALSAGSNVEGGYLVVPEVFVNSLIKFLDDQVFVRRLATTYSLPMATSLGAPELTADPSDADWTTEIATGSEDSAMRFGKRSIRPHPLAKRIKVSRTLLRQAMMGAEQLVRDRMGYKFAITEEKAFLTGTGAGQPLGLFTASADGISTARDVATANTTTAITGDGLINAKYSLKGPYQQRAVWLFHRDAVKMIAKLKDNDGQYLWRTGLAAGDPDMILNRPFYMSEYVPNTFTTGLYVGMFGDLSHYWIVDALDMQMQRLEELYAETNQVGFIARKETDGAPVLAEAFARVTLA